MKKRLLATLLALCLIVGLFPTMALADGVEGNKNGTCGAAGNEDKVTWALTENGDNPATYTLTISGTGDMADYTSKNSTPWKTYNTQITSASVSDGVTYIGNSAFNGLSNLTEVHIGKDVSSIGDDVFSEASSMEKIDLDEGNAYLTLQDGILFNIEKTVLMYSPAASTPADYAIPSTVTTIGDSAFIESKRLTSVVIPSSVTKIDRAAFARSGLTSVDIPDSVTEIGRYAFFNTAAATIKIGNGIKTWETNVFAGNQNLTSVTFADNFVTSGRSDTADNQDHYCSLANMITTGNGVFACSNVTSITFGENSKIDEIADFTALPNIQTVTFGANTQIQKISAGAFKGGSQSSPNEKLTTVTFGADCTIGEIEETAFVDCIALANFGGENLSIGKIGSSAFARTKLTEIKLIGTTSVSVYAFLDCTSVVAVDLTQAQLTEVGDSAFGGPNGHFAEGAVIYFGNSDTRNKITDQNYKENIKPIYAVTDGGTFTSDAPFSANTLAEPDKAGYIFGGWFDNASFTGDAVTTPPTAGQTYYAKWTECTEHEEEAQETTPATCETAGETTYTCKKCGATIRTETIPALGHSYGEWAVTVTPTTTAGGQLTRTCANDSNHTEIKTLPALNTTEYTYTVTKQAGVYEAGEAEYTITVDGQVITITVALPALPLFPPVNPSTPSKPVKPEEPDTPVIPGGLPFMDVNTGDWFYEDVAYVYAQGIMTGSTATSFVPNDAMTRAMVWTVLGRMSGENVEGGSPWYALAQAWAVSDGVSDGTEPNSSITREQLVTMLYRQAGSPEVGVSELALLGRFTDGESVSDWAEEAMAWAVAQGILTGEGDLLNPQAAATRAQVAAILARYCETI